MQWDLSKPGLSLFRKFVADRVAEATKARAEIQSAPDDTARALLEAKHRAIEGVIADVRVLGDAVISAFFAEDKPKAREKRRATIESWVAGSPVKWDELRAAAASLRVGEHPLPPFHWTVEFPEVFSRENAGFDAIVGNPPFLGGSILSETISKQYVAWLLTAFTPAHGKSDLVAFFFRRSFTISRFGGALGLIATKTIRQGFSRISALEYILENGGTVYRAHRRYKWPGEAAVVVAIIHIAKGARANGTLDGQPANQITSFLMPFGPNRRPAILMENRGLVYSGLNPNGSGFVLELPDRETLVDECPECAQFIIPYLSSDDLNGDPNARPSRVIIDVGSLTEEMLQGYGPLYQHLSSTVKTERAKNPDARLREQWWKFSRPAAKLNENIARFSRVLVMGRLATHHTFAFQAAQNKFSDAISVFLLAQFDAFAVLQSRSHEVWAKFLGSSFKDDPRYIPEDCFDTYPFSRSQEGLTQIGEKYWKRRAELMIARGEGMTKIYNRFHDPAEQSADIVRLRELHAEMDRAVLRAYAASASNDEDAAAWNDLADRAEPIFLDETNEDDHTYQDRLFWPSAFRDEVLSRLLALNAERAAAECAAGIAPAIADAEETEAVES